MKLSRQGPTPGEFVSHMLACVGNPERRYFKSVFKFEPRDIWVGLFWDRKDIEYEYAKDFVRSSHRWRYDVFICLLPCVLFRFSVECGKPQWKRGNPAVFNRGRDETNAQLAPENQMTKNPCEPTP